VYFATRLATKLAPLVIVVDDKGRLVANRFVLDTGPGAARREVDSIASDVVWSKALCENAATQLREYFAGKRRNFELELAPQGTEFQQRVWQAVREIPYGETRTYGQLAAELGIPKAARAVGHANAMTPACIVIPCHRVVGARGHLCGYAYGLDLKDRLLVHEGALGPRLFNGA
jgi:methylated-DNA-[protein]-cysteine S-methyltransferase